MMNIKRFVFVGISLLAGVFAPFALRAASSAISIGTVSPVTATVGIPAMLSVSVSSNAGSITSCNLYVDNNDVGAMTVSMGSASRSYTFSGSQVYTLFVFCHDSAGNFNSGPNVGVWAQSGGAGGYGGGDIVPPNVGQISPVSAVASKEVILTALVSDSGGVVSCELFLSGISQGSMVIVNGIASKAYTFSGAGTFSAYAQCKDATGNTGTGAAVAMTVSAAPAVPPPTSGEGALIKLACAAGAGSDAPCKAVYFQGKDGKRHAFPNDKVYFSWYADFSAVKEVSPETLAAIPLGKNVTYRPGSRMVKFTTVNNVYAVAKGGVLRWVKTEADAAALYGVNWNKKIDDISDAFFSSYSYGSDVTPNQPFNVELELQGASTIDATL